MVEITGSADDRKYANDIADWCARELATARSTGSLETRPFVQNADLIIAALREYATGKALLAGVAAIGGSFRDLTKDLPRRSGESD